MSVQAGIWNFNGEPVDRTLLTTISSQTSDYGPDGEAFHMDGNVALLYRPFHTTAESRLEHQPYVCPDGQVITLDGRLDNRDDLIDQLGPPLTRNSADVAIVAAAFDRWSTSCFTRLLGDWAMAVWSPKDREVILARDYIGVKRLFYYEKPNGLAWCNQLAPLVFGGARFTLCDEYIAGYLAFHPDAHLTPYAEIRCVPPGKFIRCAAGTTTLHAYWAFNPRSKVRFRTDAEYEEQFRYLFRQAVRRRLRTDSPILAELSGGLDSSSIVCMADDVVSKERPQTPTIDTLSLYDFSEPDEDDHFYFSHIEQKRGRSGFHVDLGASGTPFTIDYRRFAATPALRMTEKLENIRSGILHKGKYRVVLSGIGGDELTGQALDPRILMAELLAALRLRELGAHLLAWSLIMRYPCAQLFFQSLSFLMPSVLRTQLTGRKKVEPWINSRFAGRYGLATRLLEAAEGSWLWLPGQKDSAQTLAGLTRQMTHSMETAEEKRYPYLDRDLAMFLLSIPKDQLLRPGQRRSLMRRALVGAVPPQVLSRRTKAGAGRSYIVLLETHSKWLDEILISPLSSDLGYINESKFRAAVLEARSGLLSPYFVRLIKGVVLEGWLRGASSRGVLELPTRVGRTSPSPAYPISV